MIFLQSTTVMYRNLSSQDSRCLLYNVSVSVLINLRKTFLANYHYLLVIVSARGGGLFLVLYIAAVFRPMLLPQLIGPSIIIKTYYTNTNLGDGNATLEVVTSLCCLHLGLSNI